jgi:excinuclease ABC subunit A
VYLLSRSVKAGGIELSTEDMRLEAIPPAGSLADLSLNSIQVFGARTHNLKNISVQIPRDQLVVITGRSGSGKSSLAVNTIFAEGQRQYMESLSLFSRQFFKQLPYADVDRIEGLPPTLCLDQKHGVTNRRSTVGTITEIYDYLRLLMARVGEIHCHQCGQTIVQHTPQQIRDRLLELPERTKIMVMAPVPNDGNEDLQPVLKLVRRERLVRVRIDGEILDIDQIPESKRKSKAAIEAITDRIIIREGVAGRLLEAIEFADRLSGGRVIVCSQIPNASTNGWSEEVFGTQYACQECSIQYEEIQPRTFSFNGPQGACRVCHGLGVITEFDPRLVITDVQKSLAENIVAPWQDLSPSRLKRQLEQLDPILDHLQFERNQPLSQMSKNDWSEFLRCGEKSRPGLLVVLEKELATTSNVDREDELLDFISTMTCHGCAGSRLNQTALSVFLSGLHIGQIVDLPIDKALSFFENLELTEEQRQIAEPITAEILHRLKFLQKVGVGYLTLGRGANTLSGGEHQRVRLATSIGSGLTNVCYVLDEPSIGLHQRDNDRLISSIQDLRQAGNSIILIEHDEATIRAADHIIDLGPGVGLDGGRIVAAGSPDEICQTSNSLTGDYLSGRRKIDTPKTRRSQNPARRLAITEARGRNLKSIDVQIPLGILVCVTGVSGSGKSTLVNHTLAPAVLGELDRVAPTPLPYGSFSGYEQIDQLILIDQKPIGRNPRGCPATVTGILNDLRRIFAATKQAKQLGFGSARFSFNSNAGWCPEC